MSKSMMPVSYTHLEGEKNAIRQMRGHAPWYMKGLKSSAQVKNRLSRIETYQELEDILEAYRYYLHTGDRCV